MKKQFNLVAFTLIFLSLAAYYVVNTTVPGEFKLEEMTKEEGNGNQKAQRAREAMEWRNAKLLDENGQFHSSYMANAIKQADELKQTGNRAGALNLQWEELGPDNVGGRTRAILIDRRDASRNTIYAGGVGGGMWKSTDGANTWNRLSGWNQWLTVSCIDQGANGTIFVGTGEGLSNAGSTSFNSGNVGGGIFRLDANDNPIQITPDEYGVSNTLTASDTFSLVNRIAVNPNDENHIIAATGRGLFQTLDGGSSWNQILITGITSGSACDVKWGRDGITIFAVVGGNNKIVTSPNGGFSWSRISSANNSGFPATQGRVEIAIAPSNPNYVYAAIATGGGATYAVYRTTNGTDPNSTWVSIGNKGPLFDPFGSNNQGWYDNVIAVSPADPNKIYMGGVDFYTWSNQSGWNLADAGLGGGNANPYYIHPDKHAITISPDDANTMYVGCDGGVYKSVNAFSAFPFPSFSVKNRGYNVTQNYSVAAGIAGEVMGGAQDNGTNYINFLGNTRMASEQVIGGDGTYAEISHVDPRIMFGGIYFGQTYRSGNKGSSFDGFYDIKIDLQGQNQPSGCGGQQDANAPFISPHWLGETFHAAGGVKTVPFKATDRKYFTGEQVTLQSAAGKYKYQYVLTTDVDSGTTVQCPDSIRSRYFVASNCGVWVTSEALDLSVIPKWYKLSTGMNGIAYSLSTSTDGNVLYVGTSSGRVYKFPNVNVRCDTTSYPAGNSAGVIFPSAAGYSNFAVASRPIEGISVDPYDNDHVVAVCSGFSTTGQAHVYETTNGGTTWTPLVTGLPNIPVYDVVTHDANTIIIATELGIWSWDRTNGTWTEENNGLPRVPVYRLIEKNLYNEACKVLYIGTHGRGMWRSTTLTAGGCSTVAGVEEVSKVSEITNLSIFPNPVSLGSKISLTLEKADNITFRVFDMTGKLYKEFSSKNNHAGENLFELDASGLSNGTYVLAATVANARTQSRLFIVAK
ncbi:MAG: T9SS type A sorting domain-containing protein [Chitinophagales bacterium]